MVSIPRYELAQAIQHDLERRLEHSAEMADARNSARSSSVPDCPRFLALPGNGGDDARAEEAIRRLPTGTRRQLEPTNATAVAVQCGCLDGEGSDAAAYA